MGKVDACRLRRKRLDLPDHLLHQVLPPSLLLEDFDIGISSQARKQRADGPKINSLTEGARLTGINKKIVSTYLHVIQPVFTFGLLFLGRLTLACRSNEFAEESASSPPSCHMSPFFLDPYPFPRTGCYQV